MATTKIPAELVAINAIQELEARIATLEG